MDVNITLEDIDGVASVELANTNEEGYIWITLRDKDKELAAKIHSEELKCAIRKINAK